MRIAVYRSIFGKFDELLPVNPLHKKEADFYLFTDTLESDDYTVVKLETKSDNLRRESRRVKLCPHQHFEGYDYYIYLDGSVEMLESPQFLIKKYLRKHDIAVLKHPWRDCVYKEIDACIKHGYIGKVNGEKQRAFLKAEGYPENNGLTENGVILRRDTEQIRGLGEYWYRIYQRYTQRDQLSFCYCAWILQIKYKLIINDIRNRYPMEFKYHEHKR